MMLVYYLHCLSVHQIWSTMIHIYLDTEGFQHNIVRTCLGYKNKDVLAPYECTKFLFS